MHDRRSDRKRPTLCRESDVLSKRNASGGAIVVRGDGRLRARDVAGMITKRAIADAVIEYLAD